MGYTQKLGLLAQSVFQDSSLNVGIGAAPSGTYKFEVTGTAKVSGILSTSAFAGINGLTTPAAALTVYDQTSGSEQLRLCNSTGSGYWGIGRENNITGDLYFNSGGALRVTFKSGGNVGIGTSSPAGKLMLYQSSAGNVLQNIVSSQGSSTQVGINLSPSMTDTEAAANPAQASIYATDSNYGANIIFANKTTGAVGNALVERGRFTSGGYFKASNNGSYFDATYLSHNFVNTSNGTEVLRVYHNGSGSGYGLRIKYVNVSPNSTDNWFLYCDDSTALRAEIRSNGGLANYSANNVNLASDKRLKKDISLLSSEWDRLKQIEIVNFKYNDSTDETALYGAIAQQVQEVYPELVIVTRKATETEPEYYGLREQPFQWLTTKVLQEAMAKIEDLKLRLDKAGL